MKTPMNNRYESELKDPGLTALLRAAYAHDPALQEAPGRTERIMRRVLTSGVRAPRQRLRWAPLGWAVSALATGAAAVVLLLGLGRPVSNQQVAKHPSQPPDPAPVVNATPSERAQPDERVVVRMPRVNVPQEQSRTAWRPPVKKTPAPANDGAQPGADGDTVATAPAGAAATFYSAGAAASTAGDYETAYTAYQAAYETEPTPDALLASAQALERVNEDYLTPEG